MDTTTTNETKHSTPAFKKSLVVLGVGPDQDWKIIFCLGVFLAIVTIILNIILFWHLDKKEVFVSGTNPSETSLSLDLDALKRTIDYYEDKAALFEQIQDDSSSLIPDPSL